MGLGDTLARAVLEIGVDASKYFSNLDLIRKDAKKLGADLTAAGKLALPFTAAIVGFGAAAVVASQQVDDALDIIRAGTGKTGDDLAGLETSFRKVFKNVPSDANLVADALAGVHKRTGLTGEGLEDLTTRILTLSRVSKTDLNETISTSTRMFGDWSIASDKQGDALDFVFRTSQQTGIGVSTLMDKIVQFGAPLRSFGFSFEESAVMMGKWEKEGVNTETVLAGLRAASIKFTEAGIPLKEGLKSTIEEMNRLGPGTKASTMALDIFGAKAAGDMKAAILEGRFAIGDLFDSIKNGKDTIMSAASDTDGFAESWSKAKHQVTLALEPIGTKLIEVAMKAMPYLISMASHVEAAVGWFMSLPAPVIATVGAIAGIVAAAGPVLMILGSLASSASTLLGLFGGGSAAMAVMGTAFTVLTGPIGIAVLAVAGAVAAFALLRSELDKGTKALRDNAQAMEDKATIEKLAHSKTTLTIEQSNELKSAMDRQSRAIKGVTQGTYDLSSGLHIAIGDISTFGKNADTTAPKIRLLTTEQLAYSKSLDAMVERWTKQDLAREVIKATDALRRMQDEGLDSYEALRMVAASAQELGQKGAELSPELAMIVVRFGDMSKVVDISQQGLSKLLSVVPNVSKQVGSLVPPLVAVGQVDLAKLLNFGKLTAEQMNVKNPSEVFRMHFNKNVGEFMQTEFPQTITSAITGGGNIFEAAGSSVAGFMLGKDGFGPKIAEGLKDTLGKGLGGAVSSLLPGIGALMGPLTSKIASFIGDAFGGNNTKQAREEFAKSMNLSLDGLYKKLQSMGEQGQRLANQALNVIGKHDEAGNKAWMDQVSKFLDETKQKEEDLATAAKDAFNAANEGIGSALGSLITGTIEEQGQFNRLSVIALNTYKGLEKTVGPVEAMKRVGSAVDVLIDSFEKSGLKSNAAFERLKRWRDLTEINAPVLQQVDALNTLMEMTETIGEMNAETFTAMAEEGLDAYTKLVAAGMTEEEARARMKPLLLQEIQLNKDKGYAIDDATQRIIAQGVANGDLADTAESMTDVFKEGISALIMMMVGPEGIPASWRKVGDAAKNTGDRVFETFAKPALNAVNAVTSALSGMASDFASGFDIPVNFNLGDMPSLGGLSAIPMASGGFGRVSAPTLFLAGEAGDEDVAFSGAGRRFGSEAPSPSDLSRLKDLHTEFQGLRRDLRTILPTMMETAARHGAQTAGRRR